MESGSPDGLCERRRRSGSGAPYFVKYFVRRRCPLVLIFFASTSLITGSLSFLVATPMPLPICSIDWPSLAVTEASSAAAVASTSAEVRLARFALRAGLPAGAALADPA